MYVTMRNASGMALIAEVVHLAARLRCSIMMYVMSLVAMRSVIGIMATVEAAQPIDLTRILITRRVNRHVM